MPKITYDPEMRKTEHGRRIYAYWKKIRNDTDFPEFEHYPGFFKWAMENGYTVGAKLLRHDGKKPFNPDNCFWIARSDWASEHVEHARDLHREQEWDKAVNRIRRHYGMEPIHSSEV